MSVAVRNRSKPAEELFTGARSAGPRTGTTRRAQRDTVLSPRFYTTNFKAMGRIDVSAVRGEWDELIAEFRQDVNRDHFAQKPEFDPVATPIAEPLHEEFIDFLVSSLTAEFSGCGRRFGSDRRAGNFSGGGRGHVGLRTRWRPRQLAIP